MWFHSRQNMLSFHTSLPSMALKSFNNTKEKPTSQSIRSKPTCLTVLDVTVMIDFFKERGKEATLRRLSGIEGHTCKRQLRCVWCKCNNKTSLSAVCHYSYLVSHTPRTPHHTLFSVVQRVERLDGKHHYVIRVAPSLSGHTVVLCVQQTEGLGGWMNCCMPLYVLYRHEQVWSYNLDNFFFSIFQLLK